MGIDKNEMTFGSGDLYFNNVRVGNCKNVTLTYTKEFAEGIPGNMINTVRQDITKESAELSAELCNLNIPELIIAMGLTMSTTQLTATSTIRVSEEVTLGATIVAQKTASEHAISTTSLVAYSPDYVTKYIRATDYTVTNSTGQRMKLAPKSASLKSKPLVIEYDYLDASALRINAGGKTTNDECALKFVHKRLDGKRVEVIFHKAQSITPLSIPFNEKDYSVHNVTFRAIADASKAKGQRLLKIIRER